MKYIAIHSLTVVDENGDVVTDRMTCYNVAINAEVTTELQGDEDEAEFMSMELSSVWADAGRSLLRSDTLEYTAIKG